MSRKIFFLGMFVSLLINLSSFSSASIIDAASCSQAHVQAAINSAVDGDIVKVPAGNCEWTKTIVCKTGAKRAICINKSIVLQGEGIDKTKINVGLAFGNNHVIGVYVNEPKSWRITGFTFSADGSNSTFKYYLFSGNSTSKSWRIDHNKFTMIPPDGFKTVGILTKSYGVVDHNVFDNPSDFCPEWVYMEGEIDGDRGYGAWQEPFSWGTANAIFIENNSFRCVIPTTGGPIMDGNKGGKAVVRYNSIHNDNIGWHGLDSGSGRAWMATEIYSNTISYDKKCSNAKQTCALDSDCPLDGKCQTGMSRVMQVRDGTALIYNNVVSGSIGHFATLINYRCFHQGAKWGDCGTKFCSISTKKSCLTDSDCPSGEICSNTENYKLCADDEYYTACKSDTDCGNVTDSCRMMFCSKSVDKICDSAKENADCPSGETCSKYLDNFDDAINPVCRDQPGRAGPHQTLTPVYAWNNGYCDTLGCTPITDAGTVSPYKIATDTCPLTAYLQEGRDYFNNIPKPDYAPFIYPHPFITDCADYPMLCDPESTNTTDTIHPAISSLTNTTTNTTIAINLTASEPANLTIQHGINNSLLDGRTENASFTTAHSSVIDNLFPNTTYFYNITLCDAAGNCAVYGYFTAATLANGLPPPKPYIRADEDENCEISDTELNIFIARWIESSDDVSMDEMMDILRKWLLPTKKYC